MIKKTALCLTALLLSSSAWASVLVRLDLASDQDSCHQSVVIEGTETASCQLTDLLFEVQAIKQDQSVKVALKIFRVADNAKALVTEREFTTGMNEPASLALEKDGQEMQLILTPVDVQ